MTNIALIKHNLKGFTGTETFYKKPLFSQYVFTDRVNFLAESVNCFWLIDYVFSNQMIEKIKKVPFQVWRIKVNEDSSASITVDDGNYNIIKEFNLVFTDFPMELCDSKEGFTLYFTDRTLLLPSEY